MSETNTGVAGIDTAKDKLDVAILGASEPRQFANNCGGFAELTRFLRRHRVARIGIEASGGYERDVVEHLRKAGFAVLVLQPIQVRAFARYKLKRAKNDRIDAELIAACAADDTTTRQPPDDRLAPAAELLTFIEQTEEDIARLKVRREHLRNGRLRRTLEADIHRLTVRRAHLIARLLTSLRQHHDLAHRILLLESIPGLGTRTALALVVRLPELGHLSREAVCALAGLAPFDDDSGHRRGPRHIAGGRARPRKSLFAATVPAVFFWNPQLRAFYDHLRARGKHHKLAIIACARKLLIYANAVLQRGSPWRTAPQAQ